MSADKKDQHVPTATIYISKTGRAESRYSHFDQNPHWWFDEKQAASPPSSNWSLGSSPQSSFLASPQEPKASISLPATSGWSQWRRDSLKNMMCFDDFATPE